MLGTWEAPNGCSSQPFLDLCPEGEVSTAFVLGTTVRNGQSLETGSKKTVDDCSGNLGVRVPSWEAFKES